MFFNPLHFDPLYWILIGPTILLAMFAQFRVQSAFSRWKRVANQRGIPGAQAAYEVLRSAGYDADDIVKLRDVGAVA